MRLAFWHEGYFLSDSANVFTSAPIALSWMAIGIACGEPDHRRIHTKEISAPAPFGSTPAESNAFKISSSTDPVMREYR